MASSSSSVTPRARWSGRTRRGDRRDVMRPPARAGGRGSRRRSRPPSGAAAGRRPSPGCRSAARSGWGIRPQVVPRASRTPGDVARRAVGVALGRRRSGTPRRARASSASRSGIGQEVVALAVGDGHPQRASRPGSARVNGVSCRSTDRRTQRCSNRRLALRSSAPGTRPASASTWKPLQMPSSRPPRAAWSRTAPITGLKRASAPARR